MLERMHELHGLEHMAFTCPNTQIALPSTVLQVGIVVPDDVAAVVALLDGTLNRIDNSLIKTLAPAHQWKRMLDDGRYGSVTDLAAGEKLVRGYLGKILILTLLAQDIVEAIMDGWQPAGTRGARVAGGVSGGVGGAEPGLVTGWPEPNQKHWRFATA